MWKKVCVWRNENRELKQKWRQWLRKRHLKSQFALLQNLLCLFQLVQLVKCWQTFLKLNSKRQYQSSGKEKESPHVFTSITKHEIWHFHVKVRQWQQRNVQKSVMHVQSCCFTNLNLLLSRSRCHRGCSSSLMLVRGGVRAFTYLLISKFMSHFINSN